LFFKKGIQGMIKKLLIFLSVLILCVLIAGIYKFNILQDDIYIEGAGAKKQDLVGPWVEDISSSVFKDQYQGFMLYEDGSAKSINMATLLYKNWQLTDDGKIIFNVKSIGNGVSFEDKETYKIISIRWDKKVLMLERNNTNFSYHRPKDDEYKLY
jgi:hypothetical protein